MLAAPVAIEAVTIHTLVVALFQCSEHPLGAEDHVPDALSADWDGSEGRRATEPRPSSIDA